MHRFPVPPSSPRAEQLAQRGGPGRARIAPGVNIRPAKATRCSWTSRSSTDRGPAQRSCRPSTRRLFEDSAVIPRAQQDLPTRRSASWDAEILRGDKRVRRRARAAALEAELKDKDRGRPGPDPAIHLRSALPAGHRATEIQDQTVYKNEAEAKSASAAAAKNKIVAEGAGRGCRWSSRAASRGEEAGQRRGLYGARRRRTEICWSSWPKRRARAGEPGPAAVREARTWWVCAWRRRAGNARLVLPTDGERRDDPLDLKTLLSASM